HEALAQDLAQGAQSQAALLRDLDVVVEEAHGAQAHRQPEDEESGDRGSGAREQVSQEVREDCGADDDDAAHRGGAALRRVRLGAVIADELAVALLDEDADERRRADQGEHEGDDRGEDDSDHDATVTPAISSPRKRRPASFEDLKSTRSPGCSSARSSSRASAIVGTHTASLPQEPSSSAAWKAGRAPSPMTIVRSMLRR